MGCSAGRGKMTGIGVVGVSPAGIGVHQALDLGNREQASEVLVTTEGEVVNVVGVRVPESGCEVLAWGEDIESRRIEPPLRSGTHRA